MSDPPSLVDAAFAAARWGWYLAAFLVLGAGSYAPFLFRARTGLSATDPELAGELSRRAARIGFAAALALLPLLLARLYFQARSLTEPGEPLTSELFRAVLGTSWGDGWQRQASMVLLAWTAFAAARGGSRFGWMVATAAGGGLGYTMGLTGHAATGEAGSTGLLIHAAHVWAGGLWLGGLAVIILAALPACRTLQRERRHPVIRALVADFSRRALVFAPLAIGLGIWLAAGYLGWSFPLHLAESSYGWVLGAKLAALAIVGAFGAYNWRVVRPALPRDDGESRLRRFGALELLFGLLLLGITAVLVSLPLPKDGV